MAGRKKSAVVWEKRESVEDLEFVCCALDLLYSCGKVTCVHLLAALLALEHPPALQDLQREMLAKYTEGLCGSPRGEADSQASSCLQGLLGHSLILRVCRFMKAASLLC